MAARDDPADRLLAVLMRDELAARRTARQAPAVADLTRRVADLEKQLEREQARNEGLKLGINQLSAELDRLREQARDRPVEHRGSPTSPICG